MPVSVGATAVTANGTALDVTVDGGSVDVEVRTVMLAVWAVAMRLAGTRAVSCVPLPVVVSAVPSQ